MAGRWHLVFPLVAYFVSGIGLTCFNKYLLGDKTYRFGFPITLILTHMITNFMLSSLTLLSLRIPFIASAFPSLSTLSSSSTHATTSSSSTNHPSDHSGPSSAAAAPLTSSSYYPSRLPFRLFLTRFVPIGVLFAVDITLTNVSFKFVPVSLTEVIKGFAPAALMLYSWRMEHLRADEAAAAKAAAAGVAVSATRLASGGAVAGGWWGKAAVIGLLSAGIGLTSYGDLSFNWNGFLAAVGALVATVLKFVLLERLLLEEETGSSEENDITKKSSDEPARVNGAGGSAEKGEAEEEEAAGEVDAKAGKKRGEYQQLAAAADDDGPHDTSVAVSQPSDDMSSSANDEQQHHQLEYQRADHSTVIVELKPIDESKELGYSDTEGNDSAPHTLQPLADKAAPLRRRSPPASSVRRSSSMQTLQTMRLDDGLADQSSMTLVIRPASNTELASPNTPHSALPFLSSSSSAVSLHNATLKSSASTSSLSARYRRPRLLPAPAAASQHKRLHPLLSLFYFSPVAALVLIPAFFRLEASPLFYPLPTAISFVSPPEVVYQTVGMILSSALLAFALNLSELSLLQSTSALTLCVVATIKFLLVVVLTSVLFEHQVSAVNAVGCMLSVAGVAGYNYIKYKEFAQQERVEAAAEKAGAAGGVGEASQVEEEGGNEKAQLMDHDR